MFSTAPIRQSFETSWRMHAGGRVCPMKQLLKSSLIIGMAMGMTSYEPVVNLEALACIYEKFNIDSRPNFLYLTIPNSLLDQFGRRRGYRRVELQLDGKNTTAGPP